MGVIYRHHHHHQSAMYNLNLIFIVYYKLGDLAVRDASCRLGHHTSWEATTDVN